MSDPSSKVDLHEDGILWMLNSTVFHPRGLALSRNTADGSFHLLGDGKEVWLFEENLAQAKKNRFDLMIEQHLEKFKERII